jgi:hypothetical protein
MRCILNFETFFIVFAHLIVEISSLRIVQRHNELLIPRLCMSIDSSIGNAPYLEALVASSTAIKKRYFFPGHHGGLHAPPALLQALQKPSSALTLDLPELDELDNLHASEVRTVINLIISQILFG